MIQIYDPRRSVYIKFVHNEGMCAILEITWGHGGIWNTIIPFLVLRFYNRELQS
jgi:hypothetical protein